MRTALLASTCLLAAPLAVQAGGLEKSGQPVTLLFEKGDVVQLELAYGIPTVTGVDSFGTRSDDSAEDFLRYGGGIKKDLNDKWSVAFIIDEPYGADLAYAPSNFAFGGTFADFHSVEGTVLARYKLNKNFSVYGGPRVARFGGDAATVGAAYGPLSGYSFQGDDDWGLGYVIGAAYTIPEKALLIALTYGSAIDFSLDSTETFPDAVGGMVFDGETDIEMPRSVNLDFQTGIAPKTLLFGSARWTNYEGWQVRAPGLAENFDAILASKDYNIWTYKLGVGRQLTEHWSGAVQALYEPSINKTLGPLNPTDGAFGLGVGGSYTTDKGIKIAGGVEYRWLGDSDIKGPFASAEFSDNYALGVGLTITAPF
ncbi:OmpP1/FadL family transporter [Amaricoccus sp.]|uniref:OmpP1/FadL family transporter n=1 Tax=Amaricoccus sp. TaxID=1872485 RepID=UPI002627AFF1|nr:outer membrane protein transport protein [Amaricoccus sp.]HRO09925.1 outer membrane protein transport protein [Amaricoccus sp.]